MERSGYPDAGAAGESGIDAPGRAEEVAAALTSTSGAVFVDVTCQKCGQRRRLDIGQPGQQPVEEFLRVLDDRLRHRPSFACFGGHFELAPPVPQFWQVDWSSLGDV